MTLDIYLTHFIILCLPIAAIAQEHVTGKNVPSSPSKVSKSISPVADAPNANHDAQPEFDFTVSQIVARYNQSAQLLNSDIRMSLKTTLANDEFTTSQLSSNKNLGGVLTSGNSFKKLRSFLLVARGDGSVASGVDVLFGITALVMAFEDPAMATKDRRSILDDLGLTDSTPLSKDIKFTRKGVQYSKTYSKLFGIMLTAEPMHQAKQGADGNPH